MQKKTDFLKIPNGRVFLRFLGNVGWICIFIIWSGCGRGGEDSPNSGDTIPEESEVQIGVMLSEKLPERIISTAPNLTEILFALGAEEHIVARSQACDFPSGVDSLPIVKTYPDLDLEQIAFYRPDLIVTTDELFTPDQIEMMNSRNIPLLVQSYRNIPQILTGIRELGEIVGKKDQAISVSDSLQQIVDQLTREREQLSTFPKAILIIGEDPLVVVGGGGYIHDLIELAGWKNAFGDKELAYFESTVEELQQVDPDIIIFPAANEIDISERFTFFPLLKKLRAYQKKHIFRIHPDLIYRPGPRLFQGLNKFADYRREFTDG